MRKEYKIVKRMSGEERRNESRSTNVLIESLTNECNRFSFCFFRFVSFSLHLRCLFDITTKPLHMWAVNEGAFKMRNDRNPKRKTNGPDCQSLLFFFFSLFIVLLLRFYFIFIVVIFFSFLRVRTSESRKTP